MTENEEAIPKTIWFVPAVVLVFAALPLPYGYYTFARTVTCLACLVLAYSSYGKRSFALPWSVVFGLMAVLFNPVIPVYLTKRTWTELDLAGAGIILVHLVFVRGIKA